MSEKPIAHGPDHRPGGFDVTPTGPWHYVLDTGTAWNSGTAYDPGDTVTHGVFQFFCLLSNTNVEPNVNSFWANYWIIDVPVFQNGFTNSGGSMVLMRYKLTIGAPNVLDKDDGSILFYSDHQVHLQGSISGGADGLTMFTLPPAYASDADIHLTCCNDSGDLVIVTIKQSGDVIFGFA